MSMEYKFVMTSKFICFLSHHMMSIIALFICVIENSKADMTDVKEMGKILRKMIQTDSVNSGVLCVRLLLRLGNLGFMSNSTTVCVVLPPGDALN